MDLIEKGTVFVQSTVSVTVPGTILDPGRWCGEKLVLEMVVSFLIYASKCKVVNKTGTTYLAELLYITKETDFSK